LQCGQVQAKGLIVSIMKRLYNEAEYFVKH
jgi:hypothetical protein